MYLDELLIEPHRYYMRFKAFLEYGGGLGAATSAIHGGLGNPIGGDEGNASLGIDSKYFGSAGKTTKTSLACKFGDPKNCKTPEAEAAEKFGFNRHGRKEAAKERWAMWIDKWRKEIPTRDTQIYT